MALGAQGVASPFLTASNHKERRTGRCRRVVHVPTFSIILHVLSDRASPAGHKSWQSCASLASQAGLLGRSPVGVGKCEGAGFDEL